MEEKVAIGDAKHPDVRLEVKKRSDLLPHEEELLGLAGFDGDVEVEAWTALGTNNQMAYCTHGAFRYFGKFPPPIATHLIEQYSTDKDIPVLDLMSGSGTTGVECVLAGHACLLNDVSPLSVLLAKVKTTKADVEELERAFRRLKSSYRPLSIEDYNFFPSGLKNIDHYFLQETQDSLRGIRKCIDDIENETVRDCLLVALVACVRRVSRATTQQGRLFLDAATAEKDAFPFFEKRFEVLLNGISNLPNEVPPVQVINQDLREPLPEDLSGIAELLILHPPYFNSYKYSSINSLELSWLGEEYAQVRKGEVREFFKVGKPENAEKYVFDMAQVINNCVDALAPNGRLALMIGDTRIHGEYIPVTRQLVDRLRDDLVLEKFALRVPKYTEASWAASQRRGRQQVGVSLCDFVLIFSKNGE